MNYEIRKIRESEYCVLDDFIYEAIFIPEGVEPPPKSIINQPDLQVYIRDFGTKKGRHMLCSGSGRQNCRCGMGT